MNPANPRRVTPAAPRSTRLALSPATWRQRSQAVLITLALLGSLSGDARAQSSSTTVASVTLPPIADHWLFVPDRLFQHSLLFDGDSGRVLGTIDSPGLLTPKLPLVSRSRNEVYSIDLDYDRGRRGTRSDYVTIYDARTFEVTGEVLLEHPTSESNTSIAHAALLDGERFLVVFSQFPDTVVSVVDLEQRAVVATVPIAGCAGVFAAGPTRFATICGDGTTALARLRADGQLDALTRSPVFFSVVDDPVIMAGARRGDDWLFVSFAGQVHEVDYSGEAPVPARPWSLLKDDETDWRPGGLQPVAVHAPSGSLYVVMHEGGAGSHKDAGPEIWRYDVAARERTARIEVPNLAAAALGPLLGIEPDGFAGRLLRWLAPNPGAHSIAVSQDDSPLLFARNGELGAIAVIEAETGSHLRNLADAGLAGPALGVP